MENFEKIIENVLKMLDEGKSEGDLLRAYPRFQKEISETFFIVRGVGKIKEGLEPSPKLTKKILSAINPSPAFSVFKFRFVIPASAVVLALALFVIFTGKQKPPQISSRPEETTLNPVIESVPETVKTETFSIAEKAAPQKETAATVSSADAEMIDSAIDGILAALGEEQSAQSGETNDPYFTESDLPQSDFDQLFNDNEI